MFIDHEDRIKRLETQAEFTRKLLEVYWGKTPLNRHLENHMEELISGIKCFVCEKHKDTFENKK